MTPSKILDAQWLKFKETAEARHVLPGGTDDWNKAWIAWRLMDPDQQAAALADVATRDAEAYEIKKAMPANYLQFRYFTRPLPERKLTAVERMLRDA